MGPEPRRLRPGRCTPAQSAAPRSDGRAHGCVRPSRPGYRDRAERSHRGGAAARALKRLHRSRTPSRRLGVGLPAGHGPGDRGQPCLPRHARDRRADLRRPRSRASRRFCRDGASARSRSPAACTTPTKPSGGLLGLQRCRGRDRGRACSSGPDLRVLYIDIDAHHGDGVQEAFAGIGRGDDDLGSRERAVHVSRHRLSRARSATARATGFSANLPLPALRHRRVLRAGVRRGGCAAGAGVSRPTSSSRSWASTRTTATRRRSSGSRCRATARSCAGSSGWPTSCARAGWRRWGAAATTSSTWCRSRGRG